MDSVFSDTAGFITAAGVPFIVSYNQNCIQDPDEVQKHISECVAGIYDYNGTRTPNKFGFEEKSDGSISSLNDIIGFNGAKLSKCSLKIGNTCFSQMPFFANKSYTFGTQCNNDVPPVNDWGITKCYAAHNNTFPDYWIGAVKQCGGVNHMPSVNQLMEIAEKLYITNEDGSVSINNKFASVLGLTPPFKMWTKVELNSDRARFVEFSNTGAVSKDTGIYRHGYTGGYAYAMCVE